MGIMIEGYVILGFVVLDGLRIGCVIYSGVEIYEF